MLEDLKKRLEFAVYATEEIRSVQSRQRQANQRLIYEAVVHSGQKISFHCGRRENIIESLVGSDLRVFYELDAVLRVGVPFSLDFDRMTDDIFLSVLNLDQDPYVFETVSFFAVSNPESILFFLLEYLDNI